MQHFMNVRAIAKRIRTAGGGFVGLVGVQSNQFPRALDLGRAVPRAGVPVVIGGFHVSGCLAMLPELPPELKEALDLGITSSRAKPRAAWPTCCAISNGTAKPVYNYLADLPDLRAPRRRFCRAKVKPRSRHYASFDAGRGCPFQCSFCTIINVQGRKSRYRTADDVEAIVRANRGAGRHPLFRYRRQFRPQPQLGGDLRPTDRAARARKLQDQAVLQVDTLCHRIPSFIEKAARAGATPCSSGLRTSIRNR